MKILIVNAGSSSLKYQLINMDNEATIAQGMIERRENFKGDGKHLTEGRNLGEAEIILGDRYVQKQQQDV